MYARDYRDIVGGGLLVALGLWAGFHSINNFDIGTVGRMGPGMFPASLGFLLAAVGALIVLPAFFRAGEGKITVDWRPMFFIMGGVAVFGATVTTLGMVPAVILLTICGVLADTKMGIVGTVILSVSLAALAYLIFILGLGIVLPVFRWPF